MSSNLIHTTDMVDIVLVVARQIVILLGWVRTPLFTQMPEWWNWYTQRA